MLRRRPDAVAVIVAVTSFVTVVRRGRSSRSPPKGLRSMIGRFLRLLLALFLAQLVLLIVFLMFVGSALVSRGGGDTVVVTDHSTLSVAISGALIEYETLPSVPFLNEPPTSLIDIVEGFDRAAQDSRFDSAFLELDMPTLGWATAEELRAAIGRFRAAGKSVYAYGTVLDEASYYVATACDSIYMPPHGKLMLNGLAYEAMFFKGTMDKLGVRATAHRIG